MRRGQLNRELHGFTDLNSLLAAPALIQLGRRLKVKRDTDEIIRHSNKGTHKKVAELVTLR